MTVKMSLRFICSTDKCRDNVLVNLININVEHLNKELNDKLRNVYGMTTLPLEFNVLKVERPLYDRHVIKTWSLGGHINKKIVYGLQYVKPYLHQVNGSTVVVQVALILKQLLKLALKL